MLHLTHEMNTSDCPYPFRVARDHPILPGGLQEAESQPPKTTTRRHRRLALGASAAKRQIGETKISRKKKQSLSVWGMPHHGKSLFSSVFASLESCSFSICSHCKHQYLFFSLANTAGLGCLVCRRVFSLGVSLIAYDAWALRTQVSPI